MLLLSGSGMKLAVRLWRNAPDEVRWVIVGLAIANFIVIPAIESVIGYVPIIEGDRIELLAAQPDYPHDDCDTGDQGCSEQT